LEGEGGDPYCAGHAARDFGGTPIELPLKYAQLIAPALAGSFVLCAVGGLPAAAQTDAEYRSVSPRELVQRWKTVRRLDKPALAAAMVARRAQVLPELRAALRSGDRAEKMFACSMIAELRDRESVADVLVATTDGDVKVRRRAATTLRVLADRRAAVRLRQILRSESDLGVLMSSIAALGKIGLSRDIGSIDDFLTHGDAGVRVVAAGALAMLGDERGLEIVLLATESDDPAVRKSATYALGLFSADAAGERVAAILADPDGAWRSYALIAQSERRLARETAAQRLATLSDAANGRSRTLAEWAVDRLTDIGDDGAITVLRKVSGRATPVGAKAERRLAVLEAQP
jgi:hypothetical protein